MSDKVDIIKVDVPLLLRILEYVHEDVDGDIELHKITERLISLSNQYGTLSMKQYDKIINEDISEYKKYFGIREAELTNKMSDYRGGVVYKLRDTRAYSNVKQAVINFSKKKKIQLVKSKFNRKKGIGYFYFRIGSNPGRESQIIQGYLSQLPEISKFKFKVLGSK